MSSGYKMKTRSKTGRVEKSQSVGGTPGKGSNYYGLLEDNAKDKEAKPVVEEVYDKERRKNSDAEESVDLIDIMDQKVDYKLSVMKKKQDQLGEQLQLILNLLQLPENKEAIDNEIEKQEAVEELEFSIHKDEEQLEQVKEQEAEVEVSELGEKSEKETKQEKVKKYKISKTQRRKKNKKRQSLLTAGINKVDINPSSGGDSDSDERSSSSSSDEGSKRISRGAKSKERAAVLQMLAHAPPEVPKIKKLDDEGFRDLYHRYKVYVDDCKRIGIKEKTIDHCISNEVGGRDWRDLFRYGFLKHTPTSPDNFTAADVMKYILEAKERAPQDTKDLCLKTLDKAVRNSYELTIDTVSARINILRADVIRHLEKAQCFHYFVKPEKGKKDENKYARGVIVNAIVNSLKPEDFRESIRLEVQNSNLRYDHIAVLDKIEKEGEFWERVHRKRQAVQKAKEKTVEQVSSQGRVAALAANPTGAKVNYFKNAKCINCHQDGHWFLRYDKEKQEYVQNCPSVCDDFKAKKKQTMDTIAEKRLKKKQQHATSRALIAETDERFLALQTAMETQRKLIEQLTNSQQASRAGGNIEREGPSEGVLRDTGADLKLLTRE